ncbi:hypothetical protein PVAP13_3KG185281 [Panicum virgatum]|uniref:Uncharacterized protein n=1 Tax=Panicum virgatum TaxID=38727 RepID=A0A8T0US12_PANVG|nr:hypothetical protein PVAP13_3KG185281 [Panicum virgatum]
MPRPHAAEHPCKVNLRGMSAGQPSESASVCCAQCNESPLPADTSWTARMASLLGPAFPVDFVPKNMIS